MATFISVTSAVGHLPAFASMMGHWSSHSALHHYVGLTSSRSDGRAPPPASLGRRGDEQNMRIDLTRREREAVLTGLIAPIYVTEEDAKVAAEILFRLRFYVQVVQLVPQDDYAAGFVVRQVVLALG